MNKKLVYVLFAILLLVALFPITAQGAAGYRLVAGQNLIVGWVFVENDADNLYVTFQTKYALGFCLLETNLHAADLWSEIPQNNGNPTPGQFDYKAEHNCAATAQYTIPLAGLDADGDGQITLAAHAVVSNWNTNQYPDWEETGWGAVCGNIDNNQFPGANWAVYAPYTIK